MRPHVDRNAKSFARIMFFYQMGVPPVRVDILMGIPGLNFQEALDGVSDLFLNELMKTEDTLEGIASFDEKRRPWGKNL